MAIKIEDIYDLNEINNIVDKYQSDGFEINAMDLHKLSNKWLAIILYNENDRKK